MSMNGRLAVNGNPSSDQALPRVCLIGAGSSGITAAKALHERGIPFDCFEKSDTVGGLWVYNNKSGVASAYRNLCINTSKPRMQYSDFPIPESYPDFCHHSHLAQYFADYVDHFGFRDKITFETNVEQATRREDGVWEVELDNGEMRPYDVLLVANGHHWNPRWPEPAFVGADTFPGKQMHSHFYRDNTIFTGKRVVVVGMGNSAMDIAVEASYVAEKTYLVAREGAWIIPKYMFGKPFDQTPDHPQLPLGLRRYLKERVLKMYVGDPERVGLPKPRHKFNSAHGSISSRIFDRVTHGAIQPKPNIQAFEGSTVRFEDGSTVEADIVIYCTGYKITFPFFDETFISAPENRIELFRRAFNPEIPNLAFMCLLQPLGATMPLAEAQGAWVGDYLTGRYALPSPGKMQADIAADQAALRKRYVRSKRHTIQVDVNDYLYHLAKERRAGARRARADGHRLPVARQADVLAAAS
jgi:dimethylaniline monooxygenase (N-oxide forming)